MTIHVYYKVIYDSSSFNDIFVLHLLRENNVEDYYLSINSDTRQIDQIFLRTNNFSTNLIIIYILYRYIIIALANIDDRFYIVYLFNLILKNESMLWGKILDNKLRFYLKHIHQNHCLELCNSLIFSCQSWTMGYNIFI